MAWNVAGVVGVTLPFSTATATRWAASARTGIAPWSSRRLGAPERRGALVA